MVKKKSKRKGKKKGKRKVKKKVVKEKPEPEAIDWVCLSNKKCVNTVIE